MKWSLNVCWLFKNCCLLSFQNTVLLISRKAIKISYPFTNNSMDVKKIATCKCNSRILASNIKAYKMKYETVLHLVSWVNLLTIVYQCIHRVELLTFNFALLIIYYDHIVLDLIKSAAILFVILARCGITNIFYYSLGVAVNFVK